MPSRNGGATEPHRTPDPQHKFHDNLSLPMDSSHPLPFSCIQFHLSPVDQSDFSWALMPLSTTLLLGGHPGPWLPSIQPHGPTPGLKTPRKTSLLPSLPQGMEEDSQTGRRDAYRPTPFPSSVYLINSFLGVRGKKAAENGLTLPQHSRHFSRAASKCIFLTHQTGPMQACD